jgi:hypothetical protein
VDSSSSEDAPPQEVQINNKNKIIKYLVNIMKISKKMIKYLIWKQN